MQPYAHAVWGAAMRATDGRSRFPQPPTPFVPPPGLQPPNLAAPFAARSLQPQAPAQLSMHRATADRPGPSRETGGKRPKLDPDDAPVKQEHGVVTVKLESSIKLES